MARRQISRELVERVLSSPQQKQTSPEGNRAAYQSLYYHDILGKEMLLRLIVGISEESVTIVTVYKTSRIEKYWAKEE